MNNKIKLTFKQRLINIKAWWAFQYRIAQLIWANAPTYQINLEKGAYYIRRGAVFQVGQPFKITDPKTGKVRTRYIENLYFNFRANKVVHKFSERPIKGLTEHFEVRR
jgi:hypothetical protein